MENSKRRSIPMQEKLRLSNPQGSSTLAELKRMQNVPYASVVGSIMYASKVPAGRYVVPTGKDNVIVSASRAKVIPAGRTILVLVVLCLLRVDSI
ncbi:hypothetical protein Tco_1240077, partial [Tanacetum coccineum]